MMWVIYIYSSVLYPVSYWWDKCQMMDERMNDDNRLRHRYFDGADHHALSRGGKDNFSKIE